MLLAISETDSKVVYDEQIATVALSLRDTDLSAFADYSPRGFKTVKSATPSK